ncbi:hypothetical protein D7Z26_00670 [Cohnella endophytica]|uniref:YtkA-like domain-containing protein n=1 Tax=Cohnella endophytica TaxID=2419778 RepID=A0A494Y7J8_9BACL|nr:hypothetical protein [Cohnella endophytica]RKP58053.1 hypothetical protein D7Z26_00670 [Cohnella endophytica]
MRKFVFFSFLAMVLVSTTACGSKGGHDKMAHGSMESGNGHGEHGGMNMSEETPTTSGEWEWNVDRLLPDQNATLTIQINDDAGKPVQKFDLNHEKPMHLIVVSKDLYSFEHIHPTYEGAGKFVITTRFPAAGSYKLIADYVPSGGQATTQSEWVEVVGTAPAPKKIVLDRELKKTIDGVEVQLGFDRLVAGNETKLTFHMTDAVTGKPITDLQPYLGAVGHVVILSEDANNYLHVHPTVEDAKGPDAEFNTTFPHGGIYKIWGQFQRNGQVFVVPFVVKVP